VLSFVLEVLFLFYLFILFLWDCGIRWSISVIVFRRYIPLASNSYFSAWAAAFEDFDSISRSHCKGFIVTLLSVRWCQRSVISSWPSFNVHYCTISTHSSVTGHKALRREEFIGLSQVTLATEEMDRNFRRLRRCHHC
jgi:hypothetical protein